MLFYTVLFRLSRLLLETCEVVDYVNINPEMKFGRYCKNDIRLMCQDLRINKTSVLEGRDEEVEEVRMAIRLLYCATAYLERAFPEQRFVVYKNGHGVLCLWSTSKIITDLTEILTALDCFDKDKRYSSRSIQ